MCVCVPPRGGRLNPTALIWLSEAHLRGNPKGQMQICHLQILVLFMYSFFTVKVNCVRACVRACMHACAGERASERKRERNSGDVCISACLASIVFIMRMSEISNVCFLLNSSFSSPSIHLSLCLHCKAKSIRTPYLHSPLWVRGLFQLITILEINLAIMLKTIMGFILGKIFSCLAIIIMLLCTKQSP